MLYLGWVFEPATCAGGCPVGVLMLMLRRHDEHVQHDASVRGLGEDLGQAEAEHRRAQAEQAAGASAASKTAELYCIIFK